MLCACDDFLDVMPDNRTEVDTAEKMRALLVSAYPATDYMLLTEFSSDNVDNYGENNPNYDRFIEQVYGWEEITESDNESNERLWSNSYIAIACANQVIEAIEELGGAEAAGLTAEMAEALLCRAYNHFILLNVFCQNYNAETASTDLGITYMMAPEQGLDPQYERASVAEIYEAIEADLKVALPWVSDSYYTVPKYHFNQKAAYAFAARFYLYYEKWDESIKYADLCLGSQPSTGLRDWEYQSTMTQQYDVIQNHYIDASLKTNLLLLTAYSKMGLVFGPYSTYSRYAHGSYLASNEDGIALAALLGHTNASFYWSPMRVYKATNLDKTIFWKLPYLFEYKDPVAGTGYRRTVYPAFTNDMVLLERAEAKILRKDYDAAASDINVWMNNISKVDWNMSVEEINEAVDTLNYSTWNVSTLKKKMSPSFSVSSGIQENMLHFVLALKRIESLGQGLRWFDIKRYGIEVERRVMGSDGLPYSKGDVLEVNDCRRALQLPRKVVDAGYEPNPRNTTEE